MGSEDLVRRTAGHLEEPNREATGTIVHRPILSRGVATEGDVVIYRLDSAPELVFRQTVGHLAAHRKRGDRVRISYRLNGGNTAIVDWVENLDLSADGPAPAESA